MGLAIGDALGLPLESIGANTSQYRQPTSNTIQTFLTPAERTQKGLARRNSYQKGDWSDDTAQSLILSKNLKLNNGFDATSFKNDLLRWFTQGYMTPRNVPAQGIGSQTRNVLTAFQTQPNINFADQLGDPNLLSSTGNGSAMRVAPIAIFYHKPNQLSTALQAARLQSKVTHPNLITQEASALITWIIHKALNNANKDQILNDLQNFATEASSPAGTQNIIALTLPNANWRTWGNNWRLYPSANGEVRNTLEVVFACVFSSNNAKEAILKAINLGGDADTIGAITGAIAGAIWGIDSLDQEWIRQVSWTKKIQDETKNLFNSGNALP